MANVVLFTNGVASYLPSVNTPDYEGNPNAIIDPDLSGLVGVDSRFWKKSGASVVEMSPAEKQAVLATYLEQKRSQVDVLNVQMPEVLTALIKVINLRLPSNKITKTELITAVKAEIV